MQTWPCCWCTYSCTLVMPCAMEAACLCCLYCTSLHSTSLTAICKRSVSIWLVMVPYLVPAIAGPKHLWPAQSCLAAILAAFSQLWAVSTAHGFVVTDMSTACMRLKPC